MILNFGLAVPGVVLIEHYGMLRCLLLGGCEGGRGGTCTVLYGTGW